MQVDKEQGGGDQENHGERHLGGDEEIAETRPFRAARTCLLGAKQAQRSPAQGCQRGRQSGEDGSECAHQSDNEDDSGLECEAVKNSVSAQPGAPEDTGGDPGERQRRTPPHTASIRLWVIRKRNWRCFDAPRA